VTARVIAAGTGININSKDMIARIKSIVSIISLSFAAFKI
jgi:hypothetical protein